MQEADRQYINLLDVLTRDVTLPEGCTDFAVRSVHPDLRSSRDYRWPWPGVWAQAPGPINETNTDGCPTDVGDGICVAKTWAGMASSGIPAITLLLCAYHRDDVLGKTEPEQKLRVKRAYIVDVVDGARLVRKYGKGVDLRGANLGHTNLWGANLRGANLGNANLVSANLTNINLWDASLIGANLWGASLRSADLSDANLMSANLRDADLGSADLRGANLWGADLDDTNLIGANLRGTTYSNNTAFSCGFDPASSGSVKVE